jgi:hypothetical protein
MAKSIPLGAQATVAVETVDVLRKYGLHGIYGIMLRQEFLAAADLLRKALGINKTSWPLSVHELSAAIFYALAQHRAMRGLYPEREHIIHRLRQSSSSSSNTRFQSTSCSSLQTPPSVDGSPYSLLPTATTWTETAIPGPSSVTMTAAAAISTTTTTTTTTSKHPPVDSYELSALDFHNMSVIDQTDTYNPDFSNPTVEVAAAILSDPRRPLISDVGCKNDDFPITTTFTPVCEPVPDSVLASLVFYAPIALNFIYAQKEVDMQLLAAQQGWRLLYAYLSQDLENLKPADRPASALFLHQEHKIACLSIRGTATINDVITDIRQVPVPFPEVDPDIGGGQKTDGDWTAVFHGQGLALCGMASAAMNLFREHIDSILFFARQGYRIRLVGHSLGGGVATMLGVLILKHLEQFTDLHQKYGPAADESSLLRVYAYGTPSCLDAKLADSVDSFVTTVVLHDDVFPRLTPTSCRGLLKHLLHIRETWVKTHIEEDLRAVGERAKTAWAPRFRQNFALRSSSPSSIKKYCKKQIQKGKKKLISVKDIAIGRPATDDNGNFCSNKYGNDITTADFSDCTGDMESLASEPNDWGERFFVPNADVSISDSFDESGKEENESHEREPDTQLLLELLGGGDTNTEGIIIDGDEFFEPEEDLLEGSDDESDSPSRDIFCDPMGELPGESINPSDSWSFDMHGGDAKSCNRSSSSDTNDENNGSAAVVLEESPLPRMFIPGKVIHIYSHRGIYKATYVPRTFRELRRISLAGNMLSNHTTKSYYEGLLEVQTARVAPEAPPRWTAFDEDDTCCCCANRFTWASTSDSKAQEARDKHNCRSCGGLVCDPCARNRVPIPSIGLTVPVRVCDRCYNDIMGGVSASSSSLTSSFLAANEEEQTTFNEFSIPASRTGSCDFPYDFDARPERIRQQRSVVVDDLVAQMRSSALTNS